MKIVTERTVLRPLQDEDYSDLYKIYSDAKVCLYLLNEPWTEENGRTEFGIKRGCQSLDDGKVILACVVDDVVIGTVSVWKTDMRETVEIGYAFNPEYSGRGYASEALLAVVKELFESYGVHRVQAVLDARNDSSAKLCERIGMRREAYYISDYWSKGEWTDSFVYGMLITDLK